MRTPRFLYAAHGHFVSNLFRHDPTRWRDRAPLAVVRWFLDRFEMWNARHDFRRMADEVLRLELVSERIKALNVVLKATEKESEER